MDIRLFHISIPLIEPFAIAGEQIDRRDVALVRVSHGTTEGWGEAAPFPGQDESIDDIFRVAETSSTTPTLAAAMSQATADASYRVAGQSLVTQPVSLPISVAVGLGGEVDGAVADGVGRFKIKIAPGHVDRVAAIRARYPDITIGVDGNGSFDTSDMGELMLLSECDVAYAEEVFSDWSESGAGAFSQQTAIPLFADESLRTEGDAAELVGQDAVAGLTIKPGRLGWGGALHAVELAEAAGKLWRASGLLETGIGRAYTNALAARSGAFISDIAPASMFLAEDVVRTSSEGGHLDVHGGAGIGVAPDMDIVERYLVRSLDF
jgi:L-alanine-DL-glutamate epimerase-like enolase superfamily enzyme